MSFDVYGALAARFTDPEYALFYEVSNGTGGTARSRADAIAMSLWPSRGLEIIGIEVKASRSDWLREKADPAKAQWIMQFCDRWYLAVSDGEIVQPGELPPTWGLLAPRGKKLVQAVEAPKLEPVPVSRAFIASLLRNASAGAERLARERVASLRNEAEETARKRVDAELARANGRAESYQREAREAEQTLNSFCQKIGIGPWEAIQHPKIGDAVRAVLACDTERFAQAAENAKGYLLSAAQSVDAALADLKRAHEKAVQHV